MAIQWVQKTNFTKQNLPPFSISGDINDAPFPRPMYVLKYLIHHYESFPWTSSSGSKSVCIFERDIIKRPIERPFIRTLFNPVPVDNEFTYGKCTETIAYADGLSQVFPKSDPSIDNDSHKLKSLPIVSLKIQSSSRKQPMKQNDHDHADNMRNTSKKIIQDNVNNHTRPTRKELKVYFTKFAEQMRKNAMEFEAFCSSISAPE